MIVDKTTSVVKRFRVVHKQWNEIANAMAKNVRLEVTVVRERDKGRSYFFCLGKPKFNSPLQERKNRRSPELALPMSHSPYEKKLDTEIRNQAILIVRRRLVRRVLGRGRRGSRQDMRLAVEDDQVERIATDVERQIDSAEQLDLTRTPRLSRVNSGEPVCCFVVC